jgi:menaquinone-dependent protoporphyrinogen oxidase
MRRPDFQLKRGQCGESGLPNKKILVTYGSRAGSTAEIADAIAQQLCTSGWTVELRPANEIDSVDGYTAAIVGSAVRYGKWLPEVIEFIDRHRSSLQKIPVAYFTVCMKAADQSPKSMQDLEQYSSAARVRVEPKTETFFAGKIDLAKLSFFEGLIVRAVGSPIADLRDWAQIRGWAIGLAQTLAAADS